MQIPTTTILITLDAATAAELERVAPARSRKRSDFVRAAIQRALWDQQELRTEAAYARQSDATDPAPVFFSAAWEPGAWEPEAWEPGAREPVALPAVARAPEVEKHGHSEKAGKVKKS